MILNGFADYNRSPEIEASTIDSLHMPGSFAKETLEQLQKFMQGTFQKVPAASTARGKRMWSLIVKNGDERVEWKYARRERGDTNPYPASSRDI